MEFAIVGRTVNLASRMQDLTRSHGADIIVTEAVRSELDPRFRVPELPPATVKGVDAQLQVFALEDLDD
jgi:adenylate cyclase